MVNLLLTLFLAPLMVNLISKFISDWLDSRRGKHTKR